MQKLFFLLIFMLFNQLVGANTIDYEAAKKYALENYSCDTIESCNKKKLFSKQNLKQDIQVFNKYFLWPFLSWAWLYKLSRNKKLYLRT